MVFTASTTGALPLLTPARTRNGFKDRTNQTSCSLVSVRIESGPSIGLGKQLQHISIRKNCYGKRSAFVTCSAARNARCFASGQTQTITIQAPKITKAPGRDRTKPPEIDDGGPGLPPFYGGGGGGGGGGGESFSGGFFLFGFLGFLGFLKDLEEDYRGSKRK